MAKKQIGATLSLKDGGFKSGIKSAISQLGTFKKNTESATSSLKKMDSQSNTVGQSLGGLVKKVAGVAAAYVGFSQAKDFLTDCVTGVMELERANTRLETLMMNVSGTTKAQVQDLIEYGDALELCTTIEGDATMAGASQLATFQLSADTIKTLLPAFQDLAVAQYGVNVSQEQMINSGNLIGKVMNGSVGALTKAGVSFTAAQEQILKTGTESEKAAALVEVLGKNFGGLAQKMAQTDEGRIRQLKNAWGSVKDEVGFAVLPAVSGLVQFVAARIPQIRDTVTSAMQGISNVFGTVWNAGKEIFSAIKNAVQDNADKFASLKEPIDSVGNALTSAFSGGVPVLTLVKDTLVPGIVSVLGSAAQAVSFVAKNWNLLSPIIYGVVGAIAVYNTISAIKNGLATVAAATTGVEVASLSGLSIAQLATTATTGALTAAQTALNAVFVASPIGWVVLAIGALIAIGVLLYKNWDTIAKFFANMWGKIKDGAAACWNAIKGAASTCWNAVKNGAVALWNGIKGVFSAVGNFVKTYIVQPVANVFSAIGAWLNSHIVQPVKNVFTTIYNIIAPIVMAIINIYKKIFEIIFTLLKVFAGWLNTNVIQPVVQTFVKIGSAIGSFFVNVWNTVLSAINTVFAWLTSVATAIGSFFTNAWTTITGVVNNVFTWFVGILQNAWQSLVNIFTPVAAFFGSIFTGAWNMVVSAFSNVVGFFQNIWNTIKSMFSAIGTAIANGISGAFKSVINGVIRFAGNLINGFIKSINWAIDVINKIPGVNITKLATVNLPMLWKGGTIEKPGNVIVGERGPEMLSLPKGARVTPLDKAGTTNHNEFNITIHAENKSVGQIVDELVPQLKLALSNL